LSVVLLHAVAIAKPAPASNGINFRENMETPSVVCASAKAMAIPKAAASNYVNFVEFARETLSQSTGKRDRVRTICRELPNGVARMIKPWMPA
jgi:hypothetical protein